MTDAYVRQRAEEVIEKPGEAWVAETPLSAGAVGLAGAVMQNVTHIAPAIAAFFFTATIVSFSGAHAPLAYFLGFLVVPALGMCLVQLAKRFPSAGGYFTYVSRTVGPRAGFLTGWMFVLYSPIVTGPIVAFLGFILEGELSSNYGWTWFHWWMFVVVALPVIAALAYLGIQLSVRTIVVVGAAEFLIVLFLGLSGLISPGPGGFTVRAFDFGYNPGDIATLSGFFLAIVFTVQGLTGWEAAAPLAEETQNPRRNIPRAIMASIVIIGLMLILVIWGQIIGWGVDNLSNLPTSAELPALVVAHRIWGGLWWLALLAMFTSVIGASLACQNVATRMWYRMGRAGVLPKALGDVHPTRKTPTNAITAQFIVSILLGLGAAAIWGPDKIFVFSVGFVLVLGVIFVYVMANVGVVLYYWRERRQEFNWIYHFVFPVGTSIILLYSVYASFNPLPAAPYNLTPVVVGVWLLLGIAVLVMLSVRGGQDWLQKAGEIVEERREK